MASGYGIDVLQRDCGSWRQRPVDLLIDIENRQARRSRRGAGRDVSWLWREPGLKCP